MFIMKKISEILIWILTIVLILQSCQQIPSQPIIQNKSFAITSTSSLEIRNGGTSTNEKFLTPNQISDKLHTNSLNFLAPDNKTFKKLSFNEEFTHRSINELIDKQNEIKE